MQTERQKNVTSAPAIGNNLFFWLVPFLLLSAVFLLLLDQACNIWRQGEASLNAESWNIAAIFAAAMGFVLCKAAALCFAARAAGVNLGFSNAAKLLCQSVFVELTLFPSKVAGDAFKYFRLPAGQQAEKVKTLMVFRVTSFAPCMMVLFLFPKSVFSWLFSALLLAAAIWFWLGKNGGRMALTPVMLSVCGHVLALLLWACQGYLLLGLVGSAAPGFAHFVGIFLLAQMTAAASSLPFGLGVKEVMFGVSLGSFLGADQLLLFLVLQRLSGELLTAFVGWLMLLPEVFSRREKPGGGVLRSIQCSDRVTACINSGLPARRG